MSNEQFNNIVEPFSNSQNDNIQKKKNEKQSKIQGNKNKFGKVFMTLAINIYIVFLITYTGANLVFYK